MENKNTLEEKIEWADKRAAQDFQKKSHRGRRKLDGLYGLRKEVTEAKQGP